MRSRDDCNERLDLISSEDTSRQKSQPIYQRYSSSFYLVAVVARHYSSRSTLNTWSPGEFAPDGTLLHPSDFFWADLAHGIPKLVANYDDMIPQLLKSLALEN